MRHNKVRLTMSPEEFRKAMLRGRPNEAEEVVHRVASEAAQKAAERTTEEVHDEAYERTWEKVYEKVWSTMFPQELRKAMLRKRAQSN
jgi:hypothetical protein